LISFVWLLNEMIEKYKYNKQGRNLASSIFYSTVQLVQLVL